MTINSDLPSPSTTTELLVELIEAWAARQDTTSAELIEQLYAYTIPRQDAYEEPFQSILDGIYWSTRRPSLEDFYAERLSKLIIELLAGEDPGRRPHDLLYNIFMLAVGLQRPAVLGPVLQDIYFNKLSKLRAICGSKFDIRILNSLRTALTVNQHNRAMWPLWQKYSRQEHVEEMEGTPLEALQGAIFLPTDSQHADQSSKQADDLPDYDAIGEVLKGVAAWCAPLHDRRKTFRECTRQLKRQIPDLEDWDMQLIMMADKHDWPRWAVESLDSLAIFDEPAEDNQPVFAYLWTPIVESLPESYRTLEASYCGDRVKKIEILTGSEYIKTLARCFERPRQVNPWSDDASVTAIMLAVPTMLWEQALKSKLQPSKHPADERHDYAGHQRLFPLSTTPIKLNTSQLEQIQKRRLKTGQAFVLSARI